MRRAAPSALEFGVVIRRFAHIVVLESHRAVCRDGFLDRRYIRVGVGSVIGDIIRVFKPVRRVFIRVRGRLRTGHGSPPHRKKFCCIKRISRRLCEISGLLLSARISERIRRSAKNAVCNCGRIQRKAVLCRRRVYARFQNACLCRRDGRIRPAKIGRALIFYRRYDPVISAIVFRHFCKLFRGQRRNNFFRLCRRTGRGDSNSAKNRGAQ